MRESCCRWLGTLNGFRVQGARVKGFKGFRVLRDSRFNAPAKPDTCLEGTARVRRSGTGRRLAPSGAWGTGVKDL